MSLAAPGTNPASNLELKLPHTIGSANQLLKVDGNGQLGWADDNSGLSISNNADNRIVTGTGSALNAEANLTFDGKTLFSASGSYPETTELIREIRGGVANGNRFSNRYIKIKNTYTGSVHGGIPIVWEANADGSNNKSYGAITTEGDGAIRFLNKAAGSEVSVGTGLGLSERLRILNNGDVGVGLTTPTTQSGRVFHLHAGANQQRFHMTNNTTGSGASDGFEIIVEESANVRIRNFEAGALMFDSGGANNEAMRIDSSGRLLVGTTSSYNGGILCIGSGQGANHPSGEGVKLAPSANTITFLDSSSNSSDIGDIQLWNTVYNNCSAKIQFYHPAANLGGIKFYTHDGTSLKERMRIRNDGYVLIGATSSDMSSADNKGYTFTNHTTSPYIRIKHAGSGSSYANHTLLHFVGASSMIGEIKQDGDGTITYASSSDYRLKENIVDLTGAITRLKNLKPKRFNFKINSGLTKDGFLAHELQEVVPESVNGTKDEVVTADSKVNNPVLADLEIGDPVYQTADASRIVPLLTAALKEAITKIETLETKVAALEAG